MGKFLYINILFLTILINVLYSQPQITYGLKSSDICSHVTNGTNKVVLDPSSVDWFLGKYNGNRRRAFFQWNLSDDIIPDGSIINSARLYIHVSPLGHTNEASLILYNMDIDLNQATSQLLWHRSDWFNNQKEYHIGFASSTNHYVDKTFYSGSSFTQAIEASLANDFFALGLVEARENLYQMPFRLSGLDVQLEIVYTPASLQVLVDQKLSDGITSVDSVGRWVEENGFIQFKVPYMFSFYPHTEEVLRATQKLLSEPKEKYYKWENYNDISNTRVFEISNDFSDVMAKLDKVFESITIENYYHSTSGISVSTDSIEFKDPWLIDYPDPLYGNNKRNRGMAAPFKNRPSPFYPDYTTSYNGDVYQGVFLNQGFNQGQWTPPYYSVRAQEEWVIPFHGRDITWYFQNWDGEHVVFQHPDQLETALVFQADGAVARANYKGHLVTGVYAPESNNSRQVLRDRLGNWHMVYEDNGNIYYTRSYDNGATWSAEKRLNAIIPGAVNSKPARNG